MTPEQIQTKLDTYFGMQSKWALPSGSTTRKQLVYISPANIELFRISLFRDSEHSWHIGSIVHSLSGQLDALENVVEE